VVIPLTSALREGQEDSQRARRSSPGPTTTQAVPPTFAPAAGTLQRGAERGSEQRDAGRRNLLHHQWRHAHRCIDPVCGSHRGAASETIEAIAISPTKGSSTVENAAYDIQIDPPTCTPAQPAAITGTAAVTAAVTLGTQATTTPGAYTATVTGTSASLTATAAVTTTVNAAPIPQAIALSGTSISIASPGASGTSTISITPSGGFTGTVAITCAVTSSPAGAIDTPTCSATQPSAISGTAAVTSTLTVKTTPASTAALDIQLHRIFAFGGGGTLAALLLFGLPLRRRKWQGLFGLLVLLAIISAAVGCGGPSVKSGPGNTGTTPGSYTVTVTGASGSIKATTAITVKVE
jgi:hypothetical protein